tara:strand:+ start:1395 stop:2012 length:618 start_codon:yes stop_codon:yes gene_type:complete
MKRVISVLDVGIGNIASVTKTLDHLGADYKICTCREDIVGAQMIIFPGVGNFSQASKILINKDLRSIIRQEVLIHKVPFLGICLGMQLIAEWGFESGKSRGLGLIDAIVEKIPKVNDIKIPHIGWNDVIHSGSGLMAGIPDGSDFYFVHSYRMSVNDPTVVNYFTSYGSEITAYLEHGNIFGVQFHPEKSQQNGLKLIKNFIDLC